MQVHWQPSTGIDELQAQLSRIEQDPRAQSSMLLICDQNNWSPAELDPVLAACQKTVVGGLFPQVIYQGQSFAQGALLISFPFAVHYGWVTGLSDPNADYDQQLQALAAKLSPQDSANGALSLFVWVDGLSKQISALLESMFYTLGLSSHFIGGGAGSLTFEQKPCLFCNQGMVADQALIIAMPIASSVAVGHGWQVISEAIQVTSAEKNVIKSLNWRPAFEVYKELVEPRANQKFDMNNFFDLAKAYPLGIARLDAEVVVRDPLQATDDGGIRCVGEVPEGSFVKVLHGTHESLIQAAAQTRRQAEANRPAGRRTELAFLVNCISRVLFHGPRLADELMAMQTSAPNLGVMTLGEIANNGSDFLEFYNKTSVLALLMYE